MGAGIAIGVPRGWRAVTRPTGRGIASPVPPRYYRKPRNGDRRPGLVPGRPHLPIHRRRPYRYPRDTILFGYHSYDRDRLVIERQVSAPPPAAPPAEPPGPEIRLGPDDALGPGVWLPARSASTTPRNGFNPGDLLPASLPIVTLNWRVYALPRPQPGQVYARIAQKVYLIDPGKRQVLAPFIPGNR